MMKPMAESVLFGWNAELDIPSAVTMVEQKCLAESHALISAVDSSFRPRELPSLIPLLARLGWHYYELGGGVVITGELLLNLIEEHDYFHGFDEIWCFESPPSEPKPEAVPLTSDIKLQREPADSLVKWMRSNSCIAGLGDGDGLNFVTFKPSLAELFSRQAQDN